MFYETCLVLFLAFYCVCSQEVPIITRGTYDLIQFPNCDGKSENKFQCGNYRARRYRNQTNTCKCKCWSGFTTYRDPSVAFSDNVYSPDVGRRGCVWYGLYREGCHFLHLPEKISHMDREFPKPTILDLTSSGNVTLVKQDDFSDNGHLCVDPYVRIPGKNLWEKVQGINFELKRSVSPPDRYTLSWTLMSSRIYDYQGLVMKLNFSECMQSSLPVNCIMTKTAGTYTGNSTCSRRTLSGRCCLFPFVHNGTKQNDCIRTDDISGGAWCPVSLDTTIDTGNHKWREICSPSLTTPSSITTKPSSRRPPSINTPPPRTRRKPTSKLHVVTNLPVGPIIVTVTHHTCKESGNVVLPTFAAKEASGGLGSNVGVIVGIVVGVLVLLVIIAFLVAYLRRRKSKGNKSRQKKRFSSTASRENILGESLYASIYSSPRHIRNNINHGYQQSIELTDDQAAAVVTRSFLRGGMKNTGSSHFYDTVENRPVTDLSSVYSMPESDYTLIKERQTKIYGTPPPVLPVILSSNPNKHLYSVLERDNDPLKHPEPTDNDTVFVEANPLYSSTVIHKASRRNPDKTVRDAAIAEANPLYMATQGVDREIPPPLPPRFYVDPMDMALEKGEADV